MNFLQADARLSDEALQAMLWASIDKAHALGIPECIVIVDSSCVDLLSFRMASAKIMSLETARAKAITAASNRSPSGGIPAAFAPAVAAATPWPCDQSPRWAADPNRWSSPRRHWGRLGTPDEDLAVAQAALAAVGAVPFD